MPYFIPHSTECSKPNRSYGAVRCLFVVVFLGCAFAGWTPLRQSIAVARLEYAIENYDRTGDHPRFDQAMIGQTNALKEAVRCGASAKAAMTLISIGESGSTTFSRQVALMFLSDVGPVSPQIVRRLEVIAASARDECDRSVAKSTLDSLKRRGEIGTK